MPALDDDFHRALKTSIFGKLKDHEARTQSFKASEVEGSLMPRWERQEITRKGQKEFLPRDITTFKSADGTEWVLGVNDEASPVLGGPRAEADEGISITKKLGIFGFSGTCYFLLPKGTNVPDGLAIKHTPTGADLTHHSIQCKNRMRREAYEGALKNLARAAVTESVKQNRAVLSFSQ